MQLQETEKIVKHANKKMNQHGNEKNALQALDMQNDGSQQCL